MLILLSAGVCRAQVVIKTDKEVYTVTGQSNFLITKTDAASKKVLYKAQTKIPDRSKGEAFYPQAAYASFVLVGDKILIVYDVWQSATNMKQCFVKSMNMADGKFSEPILLFATKMNSLYSSNEVVHKAVYAPNKEKVAIVKDNISPTYNIDPEISIYDTNTLTLLVNKKISAKYEGHKRVFDLGNTAMDNNGNITTVFRLMNEKTKVTTKSYTADIAFKEPDLTNITEMNAVADSEEAGNQMAHGQFYQTIDDYIHSKPIPNIGIQNGSYSGGPFGAGNNFKLIDDAGNLSKQSSKNLPSEIFTYKRSSTSEAYVMRIIDKTPYIILSIGKLNFYALYSDQEKRYTTEGWDGELKKFKESYFEDFLEKNDLLKDYKKDKPKREFRDDVNGYFNKVVHWQVKYFNLLNEKMR